jgi:flavodoxin I
MKILILYDSVHGNTEKIAQAIGGALEGEVKVARVGQVSPSELTTFDLVVIGSPTHGGRPTEAITGLLDQLAASALQGVKVAAFDTRIPAKWVRIFGYAGPRIADSLKGKGATLVAPAEGFIVKGTEGPLKDGQLERAARWAQGLAR